MGLCSSKKEPDAAPAGSGGPSGSTGEPMRRMSYSAPETAAEGVKLPFPDNKIGLNSNHGIKPAGPFNGATAKINQDRGLISYPLCNNAHQMLLAVYDGHGLHGELVSEFASFTYVDLLEADAEALKADPVECMKRNMIKCDDLIRKKKNVPSQESGSTAIVALMTDTQIITACVGDSRCVKGTDEGGDKWTTTDLSEDQKPDDPKEKARIESCGGYVSRASEAYGPARVWRGGFGIGPGLAMSRSLGDHGVAEVGVTAEPEMVVNTITANDKVVILASDGVWEFITSEEAVAMCQSKHPNASAATKLLIRESNARWKAAEGNYRDDITAIVVFLPIFEGSMEEQGKAVAAKGEKHTFVHDADDADVDKQHTATDAEEIKLTTATEEPKEGEGSPAPFIKRRLSMASGMTQEGPE